MKILSGIKIVVVLIFISSNTSSFINAKKQVKFVKRQSFKRKISVLKQRSYKSKMLTFMKYNRQSAKIG